MTIHCWINDYPLTVLGLHFQTVAGWRDGDTRHPPTVQVPGYAGALRTGIPAFEDREIVATGNILGSSQAGVSRAIDTFKNLAGAGLIELRFLDDVSRTFLAELAAAELSPPPLQFGRNGWVRGIVARFACQHPRAFDQLGRTLSFSSAVNVPLGSAPVNPVIRVLAPAGSVTNPTVTYRDIAGNIRGQLGLTQVLAATDWIEINMDTKVISRVLSGVVSGPVPILSGDFFALDPADGDQINGTGPTLEVAASAGAPTGLALYRRMWQ
jgi:hypothetical protein